MWSPPARHVTVFMGFLGFVMVYALRVNLSVAMVAMTNTTTNNDDNSTTLPECPSSSNSSSDSTSGGEFYWDEETQNLILGAFFYGYIFTQIPGGMLAEMYGAKWVYGLGVLWTAVLTLVTPLVARWGGVPLLIALRVLEGIGEGVTYPAMHALLSPWLPPLERTNLGVFVYSGAQFGTVISLPISGYLCASDIMGGWPSVFYIFGIIGCLWFIPWCFLVYSSPAEHPRISQDELHYITSSLEHKSGVEHHVKTNYFQVFRWFFTSKPVWALNISLISIGWTAYLTIFSFPEYFDRILNFSISENGLISSLPYAAFWLISIFSGYISDVIRAKNWLSTTVVRKLFTSSGLVLGAIGLVVVGYIGCDRNLAITVLIVTVGLSGLCAGGTAMNHLDLAPQYAGSLLGLTNTIFTVPGMVAPLVVGVLTNHMQTRAQWLKVFYASGAVILLGGAVFAVFGSGELQSWARDNDEDLIDDQQPAIEDDDSKDFSAIQA